MTKRSFPTGCLLPVYDGQGYVGGVVGIVQHGLGGHTGLCRSFGAWRPSGVEVPVPLWEVAARDLNPDAVPRLERVGRGAKVYAVLIDLVRRNRRRFGERLAVAGPHDPLLDVRRAPLRRDVAQLDG